MAKQHSSKEYKILRFRQKQASSPDPQNPFRVGARVGFLFLPVKLTTPINNFHVVLPAFLKDC